MAMTSYYEIVCDCGHEGKMRIRENDTPYRGANWYSYVLIGFNGFPYRSETFDSWDVVLSIMKPTCPECSKPVTGKNIVV
jgi:hypothetical protein